MENDEAEPKSMYISEMDSNEVELYDVKGLVLTLLDDFGIGLNIHHHKLHFSE